jgi:hypothetical protein
MISLITSSTTDPWCPTRYPYQMMFVSFNSNTMGVTSEAEQLTLHMVKPVYHLQLRCGGYKHQINQPELKTNIKVLR